MVLNFNGSFTFGNLFGKNIIIFVDNRKKDILIIGKGPTKRLHDIILTAEKEYDINLTKQQKKFCLCIITGRLVI